MNTPLQGMLISVRLLVLQTSDPDGEATVVTQYHTLVAQREWRGKLYSEVERLTADVRQNA